MGMACLAPREYSRVCSWAAVLLTVYIGGMSLQALCMFHHQKPNLETYF